MLRLRFQNLIFGSHTYNCRSFRNKSIKSDVKDVPYETSIHHKKDSINSGEKSFPTEVDAVVIGAGSLGCSTAYHLAKFNAGKVLLLEKHKVTSETLLNSHL